MAYLSEVHSEATSIFAAESLFCKLYIIFTLVVWTHSQFGSSIMYIHIYIYILCCIYINMSCVQYIYIYNIHSIYIYTHNIIILFLCIDLCTVMQRNTAASMECWAEMLMLEAVTWWVARLCRVSRLSQCSHGMDQWIGLRENLRETIDFPIKIMGLSCKFSLKPIHWMEVKTWYGNAIRKPRWIYG